MRLRATINGGKGQIRPIASRGVGQAAPSHPPLRPLVAAEMTNAGDKRRSLPALVKMPVVMAGELLPAMVIVLEVHAQSASPIVDMNAR